MQLEEAATRDPRDRSWFESCLGPVFAFLTDALGGPPSTVTINGRRFRLAPLGEGAFSFVFAAEEIGTGHTFALKRMTCQDNESVREALREAELYRLFRHRNIIALHDSCVLDSPRVPGAKDVYMLLPLYRRGTLQDLINDIGARDRLEEDEVLAIALGLCEAVAQLHHFKPPGSSVETPLAHRDIKPGNVLLADDDQPVLMDFGSVTKARVTVKTRTEAVALSDLAGERCTMPYRAPELFDVATGVTLDERTDIWSIGCTIYAVAYGISPFERQAAGGSLSLAIVNGRFEYPRDDPYSAKLRGIINFCLVVDKDQRPFVDEVLERLRTARQ